MSQTVSNQTPARNASGSKPAEVAVRPAAALAATPAASLVRPKIDTKTIVSLAMLTAIAYIVMRLFEGKWKEISIPVYAIGVIFLASFVVTAL